MGSLHYLPMIILMAGIAAVIIGIILAVMPVVLFLRAIFMRSKKTSQAVSEFKKQLDYAVWLILFFIGCAVVYSIGKLIYQFWT